MWIWFGTRFAIFLQHGRELVAAGIGYTLTYPENLQTPILEDTGEDPI